MILPFVGVAEASTVLPVNNSKGVPLFGFIDIR
jgi:hypothetical protein